MSGCKAKVGAREVVRWRKIVGGLGQKASSKSVGSKVKKCIVQRQFLARTVENCKIQISMGQAVINPTGKIARCVVHLFCLN